MKVRLGLAVTRLEDMFDTVKDGEKVKWHNREEYIAKNHPNDWGWLAVLSVRKKAREELRTCKRNFNWLWQVTDTIDDEKYESKSVDELSKMINVSRSTISSGCNTGKLVHKRYLVTRKKLKKEPQK